MNSELFCEFVQALEGWLKGRSKNGHRKVIVILDNAQTYKSRKTLEVLRASKYEYLFIPPYSPQLAPIEMFFGHFKKFLKNGNNIKFVEWTSVIGLDKIKDAL